MKKIFEKKWFFLWIAVFLSFFSCHKKAEKNEEILVKIDNYEIIRQDLDWMVQQQPDFLRGSQIYDKARVRDDRMHALYALVDMVLLAHDVELSPVEERALTRQALSDWALAHPEELVERLPAPVTDDEVMAEIKRHPTRYRVPATYRFYAVNTFSAKRAAVLRLGYALSLGAANIELVRQKFANNLIEVSMQESELIGPLSEEDVSLWTCSQGLAVLAEALPGRPSQLIHCDENAYAFVDVVEKVPSHVMSVDEAKYRAAVFLNEEKRREALEREVR